METSEALDGLRKDFLEGKHRFAGAFDHDAALMELIPASEFKTMEMALDMLDECTPDNPGVFGVYIQGGRRLITETHFDYVYGHDIQDPEIAAIIGKAAQRARLLEKTNELEAWWRRRNLEGA